MERAIIAVRSDVSIHGIFELSQYRMDLTRGTAWVGYQFLAQLW